MDWKKETVNIIYASNDGYARHLAASLLSLLENGRRIPSMAVYVLSVGMCREYQQRLKGMAKAHGRELFVVELGNLKERFPYDVDTRGFDISAMGRLFAPEVLPEEVKRALYLDCDTIVRGDIRGLYGTDLKGALAGMVMEPTVYPIPTVTYTTPQVSTVKSWITSWNSRTSTVDASANMQSNIRALSMWKVHVPGAKKQISLCLLPLRMKSTVTMPRNLSPTV